MTNDIVEKENIPGDGNGDKRRVTGIRQYPERKNPLETLETEEKGRRSTGGLPPLKETLKSEE